MHVLIIGMTESGKSTLAKIMAKCLIDSGKKVAVLDPMHDLGWSATFKTEDPAEFDSYLRKERELFFFVDESGTVFREGNDSTYFWWATKSRHWGHSGIFLAQRTIQIPRTMRDQTNHLSLFTAALDDGKLLAAEWNQPGLAQCHILPQLHYYSCNRYGKIDNLAIRDYKEIVNAGHGSNDNGDSGNRSRGGDMDKRKRKK